MASTSLPYNLAHAIGNVAFCLLIGPAFIRALRRYRRRFEVRWPVPGAAAAATVAAVLVVAGGLSTPPSAQAAGSSDRAARYLLRAQNRDGGFGNAPRASSNGLMTGWAALGLGAARKNPSYVKRRGGRTITGYLSRTARGLRDLGELERTILVLKAAGVSPRRFAGRNLVAELVAERRGDGSFRGQVSYTAFGILALRAAGKKVGDNTMTWLGRAQNSDGGFGLSPALGSDNDLTGAALQALAAAGRGRGDAAGDGVTYLRRVQNPDGGYGTKQGRSSNSQSTAYVVQGLVAAGAGGDVVGRALGYLKARQRRDGSIAFSADSAQTPVWVTAQALPALRRKPFPLASAPKPRRRRRARSSAAARAAVADRPKVSRGRSAARREKPGARGEATSRPVGDLAGLAPHRAGAATGVVAKDDGPPPLLWGAGIAAVMLGAGLTRRRLRRRHGA